MGAGFDIPTIRNKSTTVFTNHAWGSAFRAYGSPQSFMGSDIAMDVMAAKLGIDPFEFRAMNCYKEKDDSRTPNGCRPDVYCEEDLFDLARWNEPVERTYFVSAQIKDIPADSFRWALPIARRELEVNPNLEQNPGY